MTPPGPADDPAAGDPEAVLAVDSGGPGPRVVLVPHGGRASAAPARLVSREPVRTGPLGQGAGHPPARLLLRTWQVHVAAGGTEVRTAVIGAAGPAGLDDDLRAARLPRKPGVRRVVRAADAVTACAGALGAQPEAVIAPVTGVNVLATDLKIRRRAESWGVCRATLSAAHGSAGPGSRRSCAASTSRPGASACLPARPGAAFGRVTGPPDVLQPRTDRPAVLASFAPDVAVRAADDPVAAGSRRGGARAPERNRRESPCRRAQRHPGRRPLPAGRPASRADARGVGAAPASGARSPRQATRWTQPHASHSLPRTPHSNWRATNIRCVSLPKRPTDSPCREREVVPGVR